MLFWTLLEVVMGEIARDFRMQNTGYQVDAKRMDNLEPKMDSWENITDEELKRYEKEMEQEDWRRHQETSEDLWQKTGDETFLERGSSSSTEHHQINHDEESRTSWGEYESNQQNEGSSPASTRWSNIEEALQSFEREKSLSKF